MRVLGSSAEFGMLGRVQSPLGVGGPSRSMAQALSPPEALSSWGQAHYQPLLLHPAPPGSGSTQPVRSSAKPSNSNRVHLCSAQPDYTTGFPNPLDNRTTFVREHLLSAPPPHPTLRLACGHHPATLWKVYESRISLDRMASLTGPRWFPHCPSPQGSGRVESKRGKREGLLPWPPLQRRVPSAECRVPRCLSLWLSWRQLS